LTCPLCGFEFERVDSLCGHGCPLGAACHLARCPMCEYEFPEKPAGTSWLRRFLGRTASPAPSACPGDGLTTVKDLRPGEAAEILGLSGESPARKNNLAVFGLVPGSEVRLIQRYPSFVLRIGETVLALDREVAGDIVVRRPEPAAG
ncbi:MAG TPA: FeoA domain-containing protein, partial [Thermoanaerobaculia bacterium]|nr:FeoA domain-containing protein [Thermoanaerobaculia bacterium]